MTLVEATRILTVGACLLLAPAQPAGAQEGGAGSTSVITLLPGDVIRVQIWREPDLNGEFLVEHDGTVTLPMLGRQDVARKPLPDVLEELISAYRDELRNPSIVLTPLRRVYVLGEVHQPGLKLVDPTVSLAGAVALAGGANPNGDLGRIRVVRGGAVVLENVPAERGLATVDVRSGDEIFVGRRGWFDRNSTFVVSALLSVTSLVISILR